VKYEKAFVEVMGGRDCLVKVFLGIIEEGTVINEANVNSNSDIRHDNEQI
jgi:hypothetical protein